MNSNREGIETDDRQCKGIRHVAVVTLRTFISQQECILPAESANLQIWNYFMRLCWVTKPDDLFGEIPVVQRGFLQKSPQPGQQDMGGRRESCYECLGRPRAWWPQTFLLPQLPYLSAEVSISKTTSKQILLNAYHFFFFLNFFFKNCHYAVQSLAAGNPACVTGLTKAFPAALEASVANVSGSAA